MPVELAEIVFSEDLDVIGGIFLRETIFFVAAFADTGCSGFAGSFVESGDVSISPVSVWERCGESLKIWFYRDFGHNFCYLH